MKPERSRRDPRPAVALLQSGLLGIAAVTAAVLVIAVGALLISFLVAATY